MTEDIEKFVARNPDKEFEDNKMYFWGKVKQPPATALKPIQAGRLKGKTDINPQWRYQVLTETLGPCGIGWKYNIEKLWNEPGAEDQVFAFALVSLYIRKSDVEWSAPIPGIGGSMLVTKEKSGMHSSDEGYKMAVTDALSVACKMLGVAADIYLGRWMGTDYIHEAEFISTDQAIELVELIKETDSNLDKFLEVAKSSSIENIITDMYPTLKATLIKKRNLMRQPGE